MANVLINDEYLTDIATAIREKSGSTNTYTTKQMANAIRNIPIEGLSADDIALERWKYMTDVYLDTAERMDTKWQYSTDLETVAGPNIRSGKLDGCTNLVSFHSGREDSVNVSFMDCTKLRDVGDSPFFLTDSCFDDTKITKVRVSGVQQRTLNNPYQISTPFSGCTDLEKVDFVNYVDFTDFQISDLFDESNTHLTTLIFRDLTQRTDLEWYLFDIDTPYFYVPASMYETYYEYTTDKNVRNHLRRIEDYPNTCNWEEA